LIFFHHLVKKKLEKENFNRQLGLFINSLRIAKGWTQPILANKMKNNAQNISRVERGEISPTLFWLSQLSDAFEMPLSDFVSQFSEFSKK
jgi:ribosome-binding protein aMBF1 (putative translation factor)